MSSAGLCEPGLCEPGLAVLRLMSRAVAV